MDGYMVLALIGMAVIVLAVFGAIRYEGDRRKTLAEIEYSRHYDDCQRSSGLDNPWDKYIAIMDLRAHFPHLDEYIKEWTYEERIRVNCIKAGQVAIEKLYELENREIGIPIAILKQGKSKLTKKTFEQISNIEMQIIRLKAPLKS